MLRRVRAVCYTPAVTGPEKLRPSINPFRGKSNRWWFKLSAASFTIKILLLVGFFFAIKYVSDSALGERDTSTPTQEESR